MKTVVLTKYGSSDKLRIKEVEKPVPADDEVLVKIHATSINAADMHIMNGMGRFLGFGFLKPKKTLGADIAGRVEAAGRQVSLFQPGDEVYGDLSGCGFGGFAEYVCVPEKVLAAKPANVSFQQAAAVPLAAITALKGLRDKGRIRAGHQVLINGASGGVGTYAVQLAKYFGAEVTAVCSTGKMEMVQALGADHVIDYTKEDIAQTDRRYDLILAINGYHPITKYKRMLKGTGVYVCIGGEKTQMFETFFLAPVISGRNGRKMCVLLAKPDRESLSFLSELLETGKLKPVMDRKYSLDQISDAFKYFCEGHSRGKVVIEI
ncbi:zinc-containing alcohol dehydrogenase [Fulvivirga imtechensis AK7]|uniref:Zinc-containing alcohol dehydrogenase n=1 Tax=Fulvivirga imtechensis AK7 TaxID=1237149 RepID=L8JSS3_9BACT|nr:NAD(P)-dependent alcohol dehydrogenase [Fulvivirga imtechensis]ELR72021.1 zinc-containing alcohol dehydrogenase [Fulvivirga imtechensis AK7]